MENEKEIIYITPKLENCKTPEPHECAEAKKLRQVARGVYLGEIPKNAKFIHSAGKVEGLRIQSEGQEIVWILDEASQLKTQAQQKSEDKLERIKHFKNSNSKLDNLFGQKLLIEHQKRNTKQLINLTYYDRKTPERMQHARAFEIIIKNLTCPNCGSSEIELVIDYPKPGNVSLACGGISCMKTFIPIMELLDTDNYD